MLFCMHKIDFDVIFSDINSYLLGGVIGQVYPTFWKELIEKMAFLVEKK